jgi:hypothetical protein
MIMHYAPEVIAMEQEIAAIEQRITNLTALKVGLEARTITPMVAALEAEILVPGSDLVAKHFDTPEAKRGEVALEAIHTGIMALIVAAVAVMVGLIMKAIRWMNGERSGVSVRHDNGRSHSSANSKTVLITPKQGDDLRKDAHRMADAVRSRPRAANISKYNVETGWYSMVQSGNSPSSLAAIEHILNPPLSSMFFEADEYTRQFHEMCKVMISFQPSLILERALKKLNELFMKFKARAEENDAKIAAMDEGPDDLTDVRMNLSIDTDFEREVHEAIGEEVQQLKDLIEIGDKLSAARNSLESNPSRTKMDLSRVNLLDLANKICFALDNAHFKEMAELEGTHKKTLDRVKDEIEKAHRTLEKIPENKVYNKHKSFTQLYRVCVFTKAQMTLLSGQAGRLTWGMFKELETNQKGLVEIQRKIDKAADAAIRQCEADMRRDGNADMIDSKEWLEYTRKCGTAEGLFNNIFI